MARMLSTKFGLVSPTEARCLADLSKELKNGKWVPRRPEKKPKPYHQVVHVWRKEDGRA